MNAIMLLSLALSLLQSVLAASQTGGAAPEIVAGLEAAIANLLKVQGTDVNYQQLESLRVTPKW